jgi:ABC-type multidrug transport system ATPase subunit
VLLAALCGLLLACTGTLIGALGAARPGWVARGRSLQAALVWVLPFAAAGVLHVRASLPPRVSVAVLGLLALGLYAAHTSGRIAAGTLTVQAAGPWRAWRSGWRGACRWLFTLGDRGTPVHALRGVSLELQPGLVGLLGPNGAGKSTFMRVLCGVLQPTRGRLELWSRPPDPRPMTARVGFLPQDFGEHECLSAREVLDYYALLHGMHDTAARGQRIEALLAEVGLAERASESVRNFSGGMRQRLGIARILVHDPDVIVVDEPTVGLDPSERIRFRHLLTRLAEARIVLFSTHVVEDISAACGRVLVLDQGRLRFEGSPEELRALASGQVFEVHDVGPDWEPGQGYRIVERRPGAEGTSTVRLLVAPGSLGGPPPPGARAAAPSLEDAYLFLLGESRPVPSAPVSAAGLVPATGAGGLA